MAGVPPRAVFLTRETELDLLLARHATREQVRFFLEARGQTLTEVEARHAVQEDALASAMRQLPEDWRHAQVSRRNLDRFMFAPEDVVVPVGQDGLVANVAKYLSGQPVIGVNPDLDRYDGVLVRFSPERVGNALRRASHGDIDFQDLTMVEGHLDTGETLLALNELFVGHRSHQSARYDITVEQGVESQSSSGVIVASGTGSTGWARSIMLGTGSDLAINPIARELGWFVREPFPSRATGTSLRAGRLAGGQPIAITSRMNDGGVVFADGIEHDFLGFGWGQTIRIGVSEKTLHLVTG